MPTKPAKSAKKSHRQDSPPPRRSPRHQPKYSPALMTHVERVMTQRQTCLDQLMQAATDTKASTDQRTKASTMMLQATTEYVKLDAEIHAEDPPAPADAA